jgi:hypothetical protein
MYVPVIGVWVLGGLGQHTKFSWTTFFSTILVLAHGFCPCTVILIPDRKNKKK